MSENRRGEGFFLLTLYRSTGSGRISCVFSGSGRIRIRPDANILGSGKIQIRPDPNSLDPVKWIHYHVVVPITVRKHALCFIT